MQQESFASLWQNSPAACDAALQSKHVCGARQRRQKSISSPAAAVTPLPTSSSSSPEPEKGGENPCCKNYGFPLFQAGR